MEDRFEKQHMRKAKARSKMPIAALVLAVLLANLVLAFFLWPKGLTKPLNLDIGDNAKTLGVIGSNTYVIREKTLVGYRPKGDLLFELPLGEGAHVICYGQTIYLADDSGSVKNINPKDGTTIAEVKTGFVQWLIYENHRLYAVGAKGVTVFDETLKEVGTYDSRGAITRVDASKDGKGLLICEVGAGEEGYFSTFSHYISGSLVYRMTYIDEFLQEAAFLEGDNFVVLTSAGLYTYEGDVLKKSKPLHQLTNWAKGDNGFAYLADNTLTSLDRKSAVRFERAVEGQVEAMGLFEEGVLCSGEGGVIYHTAENTTTFSTQGASVLFASPNRQYAIYKDRIVPITKKGMEESITQ